MTKANGVRLHTAAVAILLWAGLPSQAHAQFFGFGGVVLDPSNLARNVLHYERRLEQIAMQKQQLEAQLAALRKLRDPSWRDIGTVLARIETLVREGEALAYNLATIDAEFQRLFPGTEVYADYPTEQGIQAARTLATLRGALGATREANAALPGGVARLQAGCYRS